MRGKWRRRRRGVSRGKSRRSDKNRGLKSGQVSLSGCLIATAFDLTRITRANASLNCIISRVLPASVFSQPFTGHEWVSAILSPLRGA